MSEKATFADALNVLYGGDKRGVKTQMAKDFKVTRQTVNNWRKANAVPDSVSDAMKERAK